MSLENLKIIGSSHIAKQSVNEIKKEVEEFKPDIIALELDVNRFILLSDPNMKKHSEKRPWVNIKRLGFKGFMFALFGQWAQKKLGEMVGMEPGAEMKKAIFLARKNKIKIALIDRDIEITMRRFSKKLSWKEKWNFVVDMFNGAVLHKKDKAMMIDLNKVPEDEIIEMLIEKLKERYPNIYQVLVHERNLILARNLSNLLIKEPDKKILAIIGAGHKKAVINYLQMEHQGI